MSAPDFIARLAARASGTAATVRPRFRSRFEDARGSDLAVIESEHTAAPPPSPRGSEPVRTSAAPSPDAVTSPVVAPPPNGSRISEQRGFPPLLSVPALPPSTAPQPDAVRSEPVIVERSERVETDSDRSVVVRAVPVVAAPVRPPAPGADQTDASAAADPEPVVRITIGRVEVRAAAPPPPAVPAPRRPAPKTDALPLHDYLRGRRSSG